MSDFGRTLIGNSDGTDQGWGSHHFVAGGAVTGNQIYGGMPKIDLTSERFADSTDFKTRVTEAGLCTEEFAKFDGFNYSRGDPVTLKLSQVVVCPAVAIETVN